MCSPIRCLQVQCMLEHHLVVLSDVWELCLTSASLCRTLRTWWRQRQCSRNGRQRRARKARQRSPRSPSSSECRTCLCAAAKDTSLVLGPDRHNNCFDALHWESTRQTPCAAEASRLRCNLVDAACTARSMLKGFWYHLSITQYTPATRAHHKTAETLLT